MAPKRKPAPVKLQRARAAQAPAYDAATGYQFPGLREAHEPELDAILAAARRFWDQRNVYGAPSSLFVADNLGMSDGELDETIAARGEQGGSRIYLNGELVGRQLAALRSKKNRKQVAALRSLYSELAHEEGHVRGLGHTPDGLMGPLRAVPGDWASLARELNIRVSKRRKWGEG